MDTEKIITELMNSPKYKERADVRAVVDEAVAELNEQTSKEKIKAVLDLLKEKLAEVLNPPSASANPSAEPPTTSLTTASTEPTRNLPSNMSAIQKAIDGLELTNEAKEKLKKMFEGYDESVATAKEIDPGVQLKSITEVFDAFTELGIDKLKEIAKFGKPTLLVTPKNSFLDKKTNMNKYKPFTDPTENNPQRDAYHSAGSSSPYENVETLNQTTVSIVDGTPQMPHIEGIAKDSRFYDRKRQFKEYYAKKGMRLINVHEAAVLEQHSLHEYERNGKDTSKIVDYFGNVRTDTASCLDDAFLTSVPVVASTFFAASGLRVHFGADAPSATNEALRGRPSVQVLEY